MEVERLRAMSESGSIPRARLEQAQAELADAQDNSILRRTLYGTLRIEDFTKEQSELMVGAAQRLVERQQERYERTKNLVARRHRCPSIADGDARRPGVSQEGARSGDISEPSWSRIYQSRRKPKAIWTNRAP